ADCYKHQPEFYDETATDVGEDEESSTDPATLEPSSTVISEPSEDELRPSKVEDPKPRNVNESSIRPVVVPQQDLDEMTYRPSSSTQRVISTPKRNRDTRAKDPGVFPDHP